MLHALALLVTATASGGPPPPACADLTAGLRAAYTFRPSKLGRDEQRTKKAEVDRLWSRVRSNARELAPCLRNALSAADVDPWLLFDGAEVLMQLDPGNETKLLEVRGLGAVEIVDVEPKSWLYLVTERAMDGFDVSEAALKWLKAPNAGYVIPERNNQKVTHDNGVLFIFGSMDEELATPTLAQFVRSEKGPSREVALWALMSQANESALKALRTLDPKTFSEKAAGSLLALRKKPALIEPRARPLRAHDEYVRALKDLANGDFAAFGSLLRRDPNGEKDLVALMKKEDLPLLRAARRKMASLRDPELIPTYNAFSQVLMTLVWKAAAPPKR